MKNILLAINIGNTNISFGVFDGPKMVERIDTPLSERVDPSLARKLKKYAGISASAICSVVPWQTTIIAHFTRKLTGRKPIIIGKDITVPIKNFYRNPQKLGQDRLVNAYAASLLYNPPLIVIDSGTAITFDAVSAKQAYLGGMIFPGMEISLKSLGEKTALLPKVRLSPPREIIGRDTENSILSGIIFGTAELCKGISAKITRRLGGKASLIGTGGDMPLLKKYSKIPIRIDKDLTLKGIYYTYKYGKTCCN